MFRKALDKLAKWQNDRQTKQVAKKSGDVDLRHFFMLQMSDAYDGRMTCSDGWTWRMIIYNDSVVWKKAAMKHECSTEMRYTEGDDFWATMYDVAQAYTKILRVARAKYFGEKSPTEQGWDTLYVDDESQALLSEHHQYKHLAETFGLSLAPVPDEPRRFQIEVSKFAAA
ncbi:MAG: hypothetical protein A3C93_02150 [Candidatus Lloydbacteria bacterium RIFCSPHIGHO2_02_FULL_54_17]|uniref:Uncharacterized protein n=1 Tax=Candidatus Lloydbacteria bacterium RIFCSPHIGHO2_02_FULL_54_17 TaxID=1798664 RepID=A0A1G2DHU9_9BACT|nr:MAG: hypothetical protein A3C93_02150 [Candidatus Lloydbacteria bacterium RIFCSPHIGHO2_02_FULL_54_17]OGZ15384.1 MAG: hypothetical protein A2948_00165 [Candidatus Lloydbacteria bacterium RIFCSPLOWO2_01_FULL_54_18]OGZ15814.1 MAG: hypothetical protein A3H76_05840 [Candidatus Lloydbacteria bacterium RIFCSPLOWO2_02_FULL_54_12]